MAVTMADISHLRKMSGAGMMDCKKALEEANGDFEKAMEIIRKKGQAVAAKRSDREASEGCVLAADKGDFAAIVALKCETDFVAKNTDFVALTQDILNVAMEKKPATKEDLLAAALADGRTIQEHITDRIGVTGEKMELGAYEFVNGASTMSYIHPGNKLATVVAFNQANVEHQMARDVAMQVAAMNPVSVRPDEVPQHIIDQELEIAKDKARQAGKPENLLDRIAQGSLQKYYKENTLLQQEFIKDAKLSIEQYLHSANKELTVLSKKTSPQGSSFLFIYSELKWKIINRVGRSEIGSRRRRRNSCRSGIIQIHGPRSRLRSRSHRALYFPRVDVGKPTPLIFPAVDVKRHSQLLACLYMRLLDTVCTKYLKTNFTRILIVRFQHIFLLFPFVPGLADTAHNRQHGNNSSCNFHLYCFYNLLRRYGFSI